MTKEHEFDRRTVLKGTAALGATASLAGCSSLPIIGDDGGGGGGLSYGSTIEGELTEDDDTEPFRDVVADSYEFSGSAGDQVVITMESDPLDPFLILTNSDGEPVAQNDDAAGAEGMWGAQINTELPEDDTFTIWATRYEPAGMTGEATGPYTLTLEEA